MPPLGAVDLAEVAPLRCEEVVLEDRLLVGLEELLPPVRIDFGYLLVCLLKPDTEGPLRPDVHVVLQQVANVAVAAQEPQQLHGDGLEKHPLGGDQRKPLREVVADLPAEHTGGARAGAVVLVDAGIHDIPQKIFVRGDNIGHFSP